MSFHDISRLIDYKLTAKQIEGFIEVANKFGGSDDSLFEIILEKIFI